jgi:hypothetical protein
MRRDHRAVPEVDHSARVAGQHQSRGGTVGVALSQRVREDVE